MENVQKLFTEFEENHKLNKLYYDIKHTLLDAYMIGYKEGMEKADEIITSILNHGN